MDDKVLENEQIVQELLDRWINKNKLFEYFENKYKNIQFQAGDGFPLSIKDIGNGKHYIIFTHSSFLSEEYFIVMNFHLIIDINKKTVKLKRKQIVSNTLPVSKIRKMIEKILN